MPISSTATSKYQKSHHNLFHIFKMLKRLAEQIEEMKATESPQKRQAFAQSSPKKEYPFNIIVRKIIDPESKEPLAITLENTYPVLNWIKGEEPIYDLYISAQGKAAKILNIYFKLPMMQTGRFAPRLDLLTKLEQGRIASTADFLIPTDKRLVKEQPLWIFIAGPSLNSLHQLQLLVENIQSFEGKKVENSTYNQIFHPKLQEDYEVKESDVPAFLFLSSTTRVSIPHLLFRVDTPSWPVIKDFTEFLPLQEPQANDDQSPQAITTPAPTDSDGSTNLKTISKPKKSSK